MPETKIAAPMLAHRNGNKVVVIDRPTTIILHPRAALRKARHKNLLRAAVALVLRTLAALAAIGAVAMVTAWAYGGPAWPTAAAGAASLALGWAAEAVESKEVRPCAES